MLKLLLKSLIQVSEKAANIARLCREDEHLFSLLVEEKSSADANPRFVADFKTLADVLIQETIKHDIGKLFPILSGKIHGEENSNFSNSLGETITVEIFNDIQQTIDRLSIVLCGDGKAAKTLAEEVHRIIDLDENQINVPDIKVEVDFNNLGIVIDPIDSTQEYIQGGHKESKCANIPANGLSCVTVLIGVYDTTTGKPLMGVVNQPFYMHVEKTYQSKIYWGISIGTTKISNIDKSSSRTNHNPKRAILSTSESAKIINILKSNNYDIIFSAGAGHKILRLITGDADLYILSKGTTFKWDTCAPQAIMEALDFKLIDLKKSINANDDIAVSYLASEGKCNSGGVFGYKTDDQKELLLNDIKNVM